MGNCENVFSIWNLYCPSFAPNLLILKERPVNCVGKINDIFVICQKKKKNGSQAKIKGDKSRVEV